MHQLPFNIIQLIFAANIKIWPVLRLTCKRFLKISKTDFVMKRIVETSHLTKKIKKSLKNNIYNELIAISKVHYVLYYNGSEPESSRVQTFYGVFHFLPIHSGFSKHVEFYGNTISPVDIKKVSKEVFIKTSRKFVKQTYKDFNSKLIEIDEDDEKGPFDYLRYDMSDYFTRCIQLIGKCGLVTVPISLVFLYWVVSR